MLFAGLSQQRQKLKSLNRKSVQKSGGRGSPSNLVKKAHQQSTLKTFIRSGSDFLKHVNSSAISESPNLTESPIHVIKNILEAADPFNNPQTLIEHWDGSSWSIVSSPNPAGVNDLSAVTAVPGTSDAWAVGYDQTSPNPYNTLTEFYC